MKNVNTVINLFVFILVLLGIGYSDIYASEHNQAARFFVPDPLPQALYRIDAKIDTSANRLDGHESIRIHNQSKSDMTQLIVDWQEEIKIIHEGEPIRFLSNEKSVLSNSQKRFDLPKPLRSGETITLDVDFGFSMRLDSYTVLEGWFPHLWWGRKSADEYEVKVDAPNDYLIAASGAFDETKGCYTTENCRKFGLVLMKSLKVFQGKSGDVDIYSYYDDDTRKCVELTHRIAIEAIDFYRNWLGFYPHKILHVVPGGLSHPAGGYPVATSIVGIHGQARMNDAPVSHWQFITAHEIGHQYWMEHVLEAPNTFWLMIGLGVYADRAFMLSKGYGDQHERDMIGRYIKGVRDQFDTRMNRLPDEMKDVDFDYNNVVNHGKGFGVISALACVLGKDTFESAYKRCLEEKKGKTLGVAEFQRLCEEESGETLDWFFDQWVRTGEFLSYEIVSRESKQSNGAYTTKVDVRNNGTLSMPVPVTALFEDGSSQCIFTDRLSDENTLVFTSQSPIKDVKIDERNELPLVVPPPPQTVTQLKRKLQGLDFDGKGDDALNIYNTLKTTNLNGRSFPWSYLGLYLYDEKHDREALAAFQNEIRQNPNSYLDLVWQGHIHDLLNERDQAIHSYKEALALNPQSWVSHDQWGMKIDRAWIEKRIRVPFERPDPAILALKKSIDKLDWTGDGDKALQLFNEAKNTKLEDQWGKLGLCLYDGKHYKEALQAFQMDFQLNPDSLNSQVWQGHIYDLLGQRENACQCYRNVLKLNPTTLARHDQYGIKIDRDWIEERLKTPFQRHEANTNIQSSPGDVQSEPGLAESLKGMGYDDSVIDKPLAVDLFKSTGKPSVKIIQKNGNARITYGWYQGDNKYPLFENFKGSTPEKLFEPGANSFGFYIDVDFQNNYHWYTELAKNNGDAHVKVYPLVKDGKDVPDSYLLCWEDLPLGTDTVDDYQDIIVLVSSVSPVNQKEFGALYSDLPHLSFHVWGRTPFAQNLTKSPVIQQILFSIRKDPKSLEQIAKEINASKENISDSLQNLERYDLVKKTENDNWLVNFPIHTEEEIIKANQIGLKYAKIEADILRDNVPALKETYERCQVSRQYPWNDVSHIIVGALCADFCVYDRIRFKPEYNDESFLPPLHPDGSRWGYSGEEELSSPLPFRKYQFYQNVYNDQDGGISRFGYYLDKKCLLDEQRQTPPSRPESLRYENIGKIWLALTIPLTVEEIQTKTGLSSDKVQSAIDEMSGWNPPGVKKENDRYKSSIPILTENDIKTLLPEVDRIAEIIFKKVSIPMEKELEEEAKKIGSRYTLPAGTSARDIALQTLSEEGIIRPIHQPPVPWNFGVWGWNGHIKMWETIE